MAEDKRYQGWQRMVAMLEALEEGEQTSKSIAARCQCSESTARRDLRWLWRHVSDVQMHPQGRTNVYTRRRLQSPELRPSYATATWLLVADKLMETVSESETREGVEAWITPARAFFDKDVDRKVVAINTGFELRPKQHLWFDEIVTALATDTVLTMTYRSSNGHQRTEEVEPWTLLIWRGRMYLVVNPISHGKRHPRLRRLDRIQHAKAMRGTKFSYPTFEEYDPVALTRPSLGPFLSAGADALQRVVLRFYDFDARYHRDYAWSVPHEVLNNDPLEIALHVQCDWGLNHFIMRLGPGVEVLEPPSLRQEIGCLLQQAAAHYANGSS